MDTPQLTARQREIYEYIVWFLRENRIPPTIREISEQFEIKSQNGIRHTLQALVKKGFIEHFPKVSRGIKVLTAETCPCCGQTMAKEAI